jgi:hypothetical protein
MSADVAYPGARLFSRDGSANFFGRTSEAVSLSEYWLRHPLTFMYGPAGIGKTSLLRAGVLPRVDVNNVALFPVGDFSRGSGAPIAPVGPHTPYTLALLRAWSAHATLPELDIFTVDEFVARRASELDSSVLMLAAIDQADDLFAGPPSRQQQRERFLRELADALQHSSLRLLISVREEALPDYTDALGEGVQIRLDGFEPDRAREVVEGPGCFDRRAADDLVAAIRTSSLVDLGGNKREIVANQVEPSLLQTACARLWHLLGAHSGMINSRELRRHGDVDAVLSAHFGAVIAAVAEVHDVPAHWLRSWLIGTFIAATGGRRDVPESQASSFGLPPTVARALEDRHLLRARSAHPRGGPRMYELISDRVIEPLRRPLGNLPEVSDPGEHLLAAERALTMGEFALAERYAQLARAVAPATDLVLHASACCLLGNLARQRSDLIKAEEHYRAALGMFEAAMEYTMVALLFVAIARTLIDRGELSAAVYELHAAVLRRPADTTIQTEFSATAQELSWRLRNQPRPPRISLG